MDFSALEVTAMISLSSCFIFRFNVASSSDLLRSASSFSLTSCSMLDFKSEAIFFIFISSSSFAFAALSALARAFVISFWDFKTASLCLISFAISDFRLATTDSIFFNSSALVFSTASALARVSAISFCKPSIFSLKVSSNASLDFKTSNRRLVSFSISFFKVEMTPSKSFVSLVFAFAAASDSACAVAMSLWSCSIFAWSSSSKLSFNSSVSSFTLNASSAFANESLNSFFTSWSSASNSSLFLASSDIDSWDRLFDSSSSFCNSTSLLSFDSMLIADFSSSFVIFWTLISYSFIRLSPALACLNNLSIRFAISLISSFFDWIVFSAFEFTELISFFSSSVFF
mmetsp:Transcript_27576/g.55272  ORF Transcript_27576/g.55272 Transcript_27576/m.55272 type:complete len:344 (-) Transcript_27576:2562-3593(-)